MLAVADLLGVPEDDHQRFIDGFGLSKSPGAVGEGEDGNVVENTLAWLDEWFAPPIDDRRREPPQDVLTDLELATKPDGRERQNTRLTPLTNAHIVGHILI